MITVRPASERGHADHGWLSTYHTFSFDTYYDTRHMGFRSLRVINEDVVQPGRGFPTHAHRDMEIVTYVLAGALEHKDSMGNGSTIRPGDVQRMSAGTGVRHSEFNHSASEPVHLLQIWILPNAQGLTPGYEQKRFGDEEQNGRLRLIAAPEGRDGAVTLHQDASLYAARIAHGTRVRHEFQPGRHGWLQVARGAVAVNGVDLRAGDGAAISGERAIEITGQDGDESEVLLFDLA